MDLIDPEEASLWLFKLGHEDDAIWLVEQSFLEKP